MSNALRDGRTHVAIIMATLILSSPFASSQSAYVPNGDICNFAADGQSSQGGYESGDYWVSPEPVKKPFRVGVAHAYNQAQSDNTAYICPGSPDPLAVPSLEPSCGKNAWEVNDVQQCADFCEWLNEEHIFNRTTSQVRAVIFGCGVFTFVNNGPGSRGLCTPGIPKLCGLTRTEILAAENGENLINDDDSTFTKCVGNADKAQFFSMSDCFSTPPPTSNLPTASPTTPPTTSVPTRSSVPPTTPSPTMSPTTPPITSVPTVPPTVAPTTPPTTSFPGATTFPTVLPSTYPTALPSKSPSVSPAAPPTTLVPSKIAVPPTVLPMVYPTTPPTTFPTALPTVPTVLPSVYMYPTTPPTTPPTTSIPAAAPTALPTVSPTTSLQSDVVPSSVDIQMIIVINVVVLIVLIGIGAVFVYKFKRNKTRLQDNQHSTNSIFNPVLIPPTTPSSNAIHLYDSVDYDGVNTLRTRETNGISNIEPQYMLPTVGSSITDYYTTAPKPSNVEHQYDVPSLGRPITDYYATAPNTATPNSKRVYETVINDDHQYTGYKQSDTAVA